MPHIAIKHYPVSLSEQENAVLVAEINELIYRAFSVTENVINLRNGVLEYIFLK